MAECRNEGFVEFADGSRELCDHRNDPNEFANFADRLEFESIIQEHVARLPRRNAPSEPIERKRTRSKQENT